MADDDGTIPLQITVGDSAGQLKTLSDSLTNVFEGLNRVVSAFDKIPGGAKAFQGVLSQVTLLKRALSEPDADIGLLNAVQRGAQATARAVKEIDTQKLMADARQIAASLRSADPERVKLAQAANQRLIDAAKFQIAQLEQLAARADGAEVRRLNQQLTRMERTLATSVAREERAQAQLEKLRERDRIQQGVQSRVRSQAVNEAFEQTPQGQRQVQTRALDEARRNAAAEEANRQTIVDSARRSATAENANFDQVQRSQASGLQGDRLNAVAENANRDAIARAEKRALDDARLDAVAEEANRLSIEATKRRELLDARLNAVAEDANLTEIARAEKRKIEGDRLNALAEEANLKAVANVKKRELEDARLNAVAEEANRQAIENAAKRKLDDDRLNAEAENRNFDQVQRAQRPKPSQAEQNASYRDSHYQRMFGDGGAALFQTQARLLVNYAALDGLLKALREGVTAVVEFDTALHTLQAVTGVTDTQIASLGKSVLDLSTNSRFSVKELMDSAVDMAKSGLSFLEIQESLSKIQTLASATGTPMKEATELYTSALETFKVNTSEADKITEQLVTTLNSSRLNVDKLNVAFQGIGVTAKESGLGFAETTSALASLSNAGLTSGQQLSQGFRQVLVDLDAPNAKFAKRLQELHIPLADVSVQSNGLVGVFENLRAGGFSASDAFETLGVRASTAFIAMLDHTEDMKAQYELTLQATGALGAQATATDTLQGNWQRLSNTWTGLLIGASSTVVGGLKSITGGLADAGKGADANSVAFKAMFTILTGTVIAGAAKGLYVMVTNLQLVRNAVIQASEALQVMNGVEAETAVVTSGVLGVMKSFAPLMLAGLGIAGVIYLLDEMNGKSENLGKQVEDLKQKETESKDAFEQKGKALETVNEFLDSTIARSQRLKEDQGALNDTVLEAKNRFGNLGSSLDGLIPDYDTLINKVMQLRHEMAGAAGVDLQNYMTSLKGQNQLAGDQVKALSGTSGLTRFLGQQGAFSTTPISQGDGTYYTPPAPPSTSEGLLSLGNKFYGNNPTASRALSFISGQNQTSDTASNVLRDLRNNPGGLSASQVEALTSAVNGLTTQLHIETDTTLKMGIAGQKDRVLQISQTPTYQSAETTVNQLKTLMGNTHFGDQSATARQQSLGNLQQEAKPMLDSLDALRSSFTSRSDLEAFDDSDVGKARAQILGKMKEIQHGVSTFASTVAVNEAKLTVETLNRQIAETQQELTHSAKTHKDPELESKLKELAQQRRDLQVSEANSDLEQQLGKAPPDSYLRDPNYRKQFLTEKTAQADSQYNQTVNRADYTGSHHGAKRDINAPIPLPADNYSADLSKQMGLIDKTATTDIAKTNIPTQAQEAFLNAASENQQFPKQVVEQKKALLDKTKDAAMGQQLTVRMQQLQSLQELETQADTMLDKNNTDFESVASKYGIKVDAGGNVDASTLNFSNDARGSQQHADFTKAYDAYMKNLKAIPEAKEKIQAEMDSVNKDIQTLQAKTDARSQAADGNFSDAFSAAKYGFDAQNSLLPGNDFKNQTNTISKTMSDLNTSTSSFFMNLVSGSAKGKNAFSEFAQSVIADALKMATNKLASTALSGLFGLATSAIGGLLGDGMASGSTLSGLSSEAAGNVSAGAAGLYTGGIAVDKASYGGGLDGVTVGAAPMPHFYLGGTLPGTYKEPRKNRNDEIKLSIPKFHFATGGSVPGTDLGRDSVHTLLAPGESVLNRGATSLVGSDMVNAMNSGAIVKANAMPSAPPARKPDMVNVYVVDKTAPPPQPGPKDMIAAITDDILLGGQTKKLIRQVAIGQL